jgi:hypothetical protein
VNWFHRARASGDDAHRQGTGDAFTVSDDVLAAALEDLEAGLTPLEVLQRYPDHEDDLGPLLQTAYALRTTRWPTMSMAGRVAGRERMHTALAEQKRRKAGFLPPIWRHIGVSAALMLMAGAAFLASPYSPLDARKFGAQPTATLVVPVMLEPTAAFAVELPALSPTVTATATRERTRRPEVTVEPSETPERIVLAEPLRATSTATAAPTATPRATRTRSSTQTPTATATVTIAPTATSPSAEAAPTTQPPAPPTVAPPTETPSPVPPKPSPTRTALPTLAPEPTSTLTAPPPPTKTRTSEPTAAPTAPPTPSKTPEPTKTERPRPRPEPTRTPKRISAGDAPVLIKANEQWPRVNVQVPPAPPRAPAHKPRRP